MVQCNTKAKEIFLKKMNIWFDGGKKTIWHSLYLLAIFCSPMRTAIVSAYRIILTRNPNSNQVLSRLSRF
jgi:hypothetical protein